MNRIKHYFAGGNTSIGFYSLINEVEPNLERIYILLGSTGTLKSEMIQRIGHAIHELGYDIEYIHSLHNVHDVEGLIVPALLLGIIDGNNSHTMLPSYPGIRDIYIDFVAAWQNDIHQQQKNELRAMSQQYIQLRQRMYDQFALAKKAHDRKEKIYISAMDFSIANRIAEQLITRMFEGAITESGTGERHFFLGASSAKGAINYIDNLTSDLSKRYIIKGRSGSGKSTLMRKIAKKAQKLGLAVHFFHCSFDPHSIDMIIIPAISVAMLDGTAPHVVDPTRETDEVIDMFTLAIDPTVEIHYAKELHEIDNTYRHHVRTAISILKEMKELYTTIEAKYRSWIDLNIHEQITQQWIAHIMDYVEKQRIST